MGEVHVFSFVFFKVMSSNPEKIHNSELLARFFTAPNKHIRSNRG